MKQELDAPPDLRRIAAQQVAAEAQVLLDGKRAEDATSFRHVAKPESDDPVRTHPDQVGAGEPDDAAAHPHQSGDGAHGRGLAGAVGPEQSDDLTLGHLKAEAVQHLYLAVGDKEVLDRQECHGATSTGASASSSPSSSLPK